MIYRFSEAEVSDKNGNKANSLIEMQRAGFNVPDGLVLDSDCFDTFLETNSLTETITKELSKSTEGLSKKTLAKFKDAKLPKEIKGQLEKLIDPKKLYAVRSSCTKEDLGDSSFAGQYQSFLFTEAKDIERRIIDCYKSTYNQNIVAYCKQNNIKLSELKMAVVVQEMVNSDYSGICFTVNPTTGDDKEMLIEIAEGIGEEIVSGHNAPEQYFYSWYNNYTKIDKNNKILDKAKLKELGKTFAKIQLHFGFPCDIEFALKNDELFILQARKITKIVYGGYDDVWTTADFKDGGVSATVCTPFMWSLYEYVWDYIIQKFLVDSKILTQDYCDKHVMGDMFFGRCYWNLSVVKKAMSNVIGYREREFDSEYGIKGDYEGEGATTKLTPKNAITLAKMALAQKKILKEREENAESYIEDMMSKYNDYTDNFDKNKAKIAKTWRKLTEKDYFQSETTYFWQIFINTIHQSLYKDSLLKFMSEDEYLTVLGGIKDISHMRPFYAMWEASRQIRNDKDELKYWQNTSSEKILKDTDSKRKSLKALKKIIADYGYHSDKELDVTFECYYENPLPYVDNIKSMIELEDSFGPENDQLHNENRYHEILEKLQGQLSAKKYQKVHAKITKMRKMLWWREEFRDVSTRFYYIIHLYSKYYGEELAKQDILKAPEDIWMLKIRDIWAYQDKKIDAKELRKIVERNHKYYNSYRNYMSDNEIVPGNCAQATTSESDIHGLGACSGKITATARVIKDFSEIDRLNKGEILVTKFTDTGWTPKFAIISGIVTEYGGILCHAAIVSREYGIPAIVNCHDAMSKIQDGQTITIDGSTGEITIEE